MKKDKSREAKSSRISLSNLKKAYYYFKRNGLKAASFAVMERLKKNAYEEYHYEDPKESVLEKQRKTLFENPITFSILVPAYQTKPEYLRALLLSLRNQTYPHWELILADASKDNMVESEILSFCEEYQEKRICYHRLSENKGISENTNAALELATGDYIGLLDHDDFLTPDALFENAIQIFSAREQGINLQMLYSDEDKCDENGENYYEVNQKVDFNLDLLLSNNYICHFLVMQKKLMQKLKFRCNFDGSQDYDLILRGVGEILPHKEEIYHIPIVLYHWRCHRDSTAANPQSKRYAYEAGKLALEDFIKTKNWRAKVEFGTHWGFYQIKYEPDILAVRDDVGIVGGSILDQRRHYIESGILNEDGRCPYQGLRFGYSGYMHRASLMQEAYAVDLRCARIRADLKPLFNEIINQEKDSLKISFKICNEAKKLGYRVLWDPTFVTTVEQVK